MKNNKGFTLIELMIVIAIIAIIAAIAIPNLMQSRIRANEATAVTVVKAYATAQVTFQVGRQGRNTANTASGDAGFCDNYRNLFFGNPVGAPGTTSAAGTTNLQLISQTHADAFGGVANDGGVSTVTAPTTPAGTAVPYQGYHFMSPTGLAATPGGGTFFQTQFAQIAVPANSTTTGTNAYFVGIQGQVWMLGLTPDKPLADNATAAAAVGKTPLTATALPNWNTL